MHKKLAQQAILQVFSVLIVLGGLVRLIANRQTFQSFTIEELWVAHPYFVYVYRVLGAFVVLVGVTTFVISRDLVRYAGILRVWGFCFLLVSCVMLLAGYFMRLSLLHYAIDLLFTFIIAVLCLSLGTRPPQK